MNEIPIIKVNRKWGTQKTEENLKWGAQTIESIPDRGINDPLTVRTIFV